MTATRNESSQWIFDILELVTTATEPPSAMEIAHQLGLSVTTTHRGLNTLAQAGYIAQHPASSRYVIANSTHQLVKGLLARFAIRGASLHYMRYVTGRTQETTTLDVPVGWYALRIATVAGLHETPTTIGVGSSTEMHASAAGLAMLAFMGDAKIARYVAWAQKHKSGKAKAIKAALAETYTEGYALSLSDETAYGALAVPIRSIGGEALAAIAIQSGALASKAGKSKLLASTVAAARRIEGVIQLEPDRFKNPYSHLPPESIVLPVKPGML